MKILIDMNLSPDWVNYFAASGMEAIHWSRIGSAQAKDTEIMEYALVNRFVVFTHDLDFGAILAATQADAPSVLQVRTQETFANVIGEGASQLGTEYKYLGKPSEIIEKSYRVEANDTRRKTKTQSLHKRDSGNLVSERRSKRCRAIENTRRHRNSSQRANVGKH